MSERLDLEDVERRFAAAKEITLGMNDYDARALIEEVRSLREQLAA